MNDDLPSVDKVGTIQIQIGQHPGRCLIWDVDDGRQNFPCSECVDECVDEIEGLEANTSARLDISPAFLEVDVGGIGQGGVEVGSQFSTSRGRPEATRLCETDFHVHA